MDKTSQKVVTKDAKRVEVARKGREKYMSKLKESILNDAKKGGRDTTNASNETTSPTSNASNETTSATNTAAAPATSTSNTTTTTTTPTRSNATYVYGVGMLAVLAIGVCVIFAYKTSQAENKKQVNKKQDQPPKRCHMF